MEGLRADGGCCWVKAQTGGSGVSKVSWAPESAWQVCARAPSDANMLSLLW